MFVVNINLTVMAQKGASLGFSKCLEREIVKSGIVLVN